MQKDGDVIVAEARALAVSCTLPQISHDIGMEGLPKAKFTELQNHLEQTLPELFKLYHDNRELFSADDGNVLEFYHDFLIVLCEQKCVDSVSSLISSIISDQVRQILYSKVILQKLRDNVEFRGKLFQYFASKLNKMDWTDNYGAILGFMEFCRLLFQKNRETFKISIDNANLITSVASILSTNSYPDMQQCGLTLYSILLFESSNAFLREGNYHVVAFDNLFKLLHKQFKNLNMKQLFKCLNHIIAVEEEFKTNFSKWGKFDDLMDTLLDLIAFESSVDNSRMLIYQFSKLVANKMKGIEISNFDDLRSEVSENPKKAYDRISKLRDCDSIRNFQVYRWVKRIMTTILMEVDKVFESDQRGDAHLNQIHIAYLLSVYCVDGDLIAPLLDNFLFSLAKSLNQRLLNRSRKEFLITLHKHSGKCLGYCENGELREFHNECGDLIASMSLSE